MPYDDLLILSGTSGSQGTTLSTNVNGATVFVGRNRVFHADMRVTGTIDGTTGNLTMAIVEQSTSTGTAFQTIARFAAQTTVMQATTTAPAAAPNSVTFRTTRDYIRFSATLSSTAAASGVEIKLRPSGEPAISGGFNNGA